MIFIGWCQCFEFLSVSLDVKKIHFTLSGWPSVLWASVLQEGQEGHPACKKLSGGVLAWLSVWSEVKTCMWPS